MVVPEPPHKQTRRSTRLTRAPIYTPTPSDTSDSEGFEADSSVYQAYDAAEDLGHSNNIEMSDELPMNPMFDPAAKPMEDLTGEGNRDLAEEERDDDEVLYHLVEKFVTLRPCLYSTSYLSCPLGLQTIRCCPNARFSSIGRPQRHPSRRTQRHYRRTPVFDFLNSNSCYFNTNGWGFM